MRKSEILALIGPNAPCLTCQVAAGEAAKAGRAELAFLLPQVANAVWTADRLSAAEKAFVNNELAGLTTCVGRTAPDRSALAASVGRSVEEITARQSGLAEVVADFLSAFSEGTTEDDGETDRS